MRMFFLIGSLLLLSNPALSAPTVTKAIISDKGIEIEGAGFGNENPMLFWDDVKSSFNLNSGVIGDLVPVSKNDKWSEKTNKWGKPFFYGHTDAARTGKSDVVYQGDGHKNFLGSPNHSQVGSLKNKIFVSWWYKPSMSPSAEGGSNKFIRIWDTSSGEGTRISWTQMHLTCGADTQSVTWGSWNGNVGEWNHHMIYVDLENENIQTWVNGSRVHNGTCRKHSAHKTVPLYVNLIGFDHGSEEYRNMSTSIDDIYIGSSQARVEISNSPSWKADMVKEVLPISNWSSNKILAQAHEGKIKLSSDMYVYVVDKDGNTNNQGFKVKCDYCPKPVPQ